MDSNNQKLNQLSEKDKIQSLNLANLFQRSDLDQAGLNNLLLNNALNQKFQSDPSDLINYNQLFGQSPFLSGLNGNPIGPADVSNIRLNAVPPSLNGIDLSNISHLINAPIQTASSLPINPDISKSIPPNPDLLTQLMKQNNFEINGSINKNGGEKMSENLSLDQLIQNQQNIQNLTPKIQEKPYSDNQKNIFGQNSNLENFQNSLQQTLNGGVMQPDLQNIDINKLLQGFNGLQNILGNSGQSSASTTQGTSTLENTKPQQQNGQTQIANSLLQTYQGILQNQNFSGLNLTAEQLNLQGISNNSSTQQLLNSSLLMPQITGLSSLQIPGYSGGISELASMNPLQNSLYSGQNNLYSPFPALGSINLGVQQNQSQNLNLAGLGLGLGMGNQNLFNFPSGNRQPPNVLIPGSAAHAAAFHAKGPDYEIKLFVGGLAFQTQESDLINYFKDFGVVADAIVMRDKQTQRGRGFGFVKMQFGDREKAQENKIKLVQYNQIKDGHVINGKRVDVKSADDFQKDQSGLQTNQGQFNNYVQQQTKTQNQNYDKSLFSQSLNNQKLEDPLLANVSKPNPYVIVETKEEEVSGGSKGNGEEGQKKQIVFTYPKSKIFVGGLDFKLNNDDLKQHFLQYGEIESAVILKDINTGQSRGFGFVTFKDEAVAQDLIQNVQITEIFGRRVDIKSAEPKQQNLNQPAPVIPRRMGNNFTNQNGNDNRNNQQNQYAVIPQYGDEQKRFRNGQGNQRDKQNDESESQTSDRRNSRRDYRGKGDDRRDQERDRNLRNEKEYGRDVKRKDYDEESRRDQRHGSRRGGNYRSRSDSNDSSKSSSSYRRSRERKNRKEKRGPHHGPHHSNNTK